jgi:hypothetical protein
MDRAHHLIFHFGPKASELSIINESSVSVRDSDDQYFSRGLGRARVETGMEKEPIREQADEIWLTK